MPKEVEIAWFIFSQQLPYSQKSALNDYYLLFTESHFFAVNPTKMMIVIVELATNSRLSTGDSDIPKELDYYQVLTHYLSIIGIWLPALGPGTKR